MGLVFFFGGVSNIYSSLFLIIIVERLPSRKKLIKKSKNSHKKSVLLWRPPSLLFFVLLPYHFQATFLKLLWQTAEQDCHYIFKGEGHDRTLIVIVFWLPGWSFGFHYSEITFGTPNRCSWHRRKLKLTPRATGFDLDKRDTLPPSHQTRRS